MLAIPVVHPVTTRTLRRFSFPLPSSTANRCRIHAHGDCCTCSTYSTRRYPLFDITINPKQSSDPGPRPFMNDLSPQMPIYLPKLTIVLSCPRLFALDAHLMPLSASMSHSWCMYARPSNSVPCVAFHVVQHLHSTQARPIRLVGSSTYSRAPLPRKWAVTPLAGRLPPLVTRCSPSTFYWPILFLCFCLFVDGKPYSYLFMMLAHRYMCGTTCCWVGEYVRTRCPRCPALNPDNEVFSTFE